MNSIFIVGNGASLKNVNLDLLTGKDSMAVNKIHKIYPSTKWRPTHYMKIDYSAFDNEDWKEEVLVHIRNGEKCLLWDAFRAGAHVSDGNREYIYDGVGDFENVRYIPRCKHHYERTVEWHPLCTGLNSIVTMVLWALELGYDEIVLVGCDGVFGDYRTDHFTEDYYSKVDADYANRNNINIGMAHAFLKEYCPVPIYRVGGILDYPEVRLEDYG